MTDFQTFQTKTSSRLSSAQQNFAAGVEQWTNFTFNYNSAILDAQNGGSLPASSQAALLSTQAFLSGRQSDAQAKAKLFKDLNEALANPPTDRPTATTFLTNTLAPIFASSTTAPATRYNFDPVAGTSFSPAYVQQKQQSYVVANLVIADPSNLSIFTPLQLAALTNAGVAVGPLVSALNQSPESIKYFVSTKANLWTSRFNQIANPIAPVLPYAPSAPAQVAPVVSQ